MVSLVKSTVLGFGLLAGVAATAYAQSVSALPPTTPSTEAQPYSATKIHPNPGGSQVWRQEPNQPTASYSPYPLPGSGTSAPGSQSQPLGPKPN